MKQTGKEKVIRMENIRIDLSTGRILTLSQQELDRRIGAVRDYMAQAGLGLVLVLNPGLDGMRYWLTGAGGPERASEGGVIIGREGDVISVQGGRMVLPGQGLEKNYSLAEVGGAAAYKGIRDMEGFDGQWITHMCGGTPRVGIVHPEWMRADLQTYLQEMIPELSMVDVTSELNKIKAIKSPETIAMLEKCARMMDKVLGSAAGFIRPDIYERDLANNLRYVAYMQGCGGQDYEESAMLRLISGNQDSEYKEAVVRFPGRRLQENDCISIRMYGLGPDNIYGGLCRTFITGTAGEKLRQLWNATAGAQTLAASLLKPGACLKDAADQANAFLTAQGFAADQSDFIHGIDYTAEATPRLHHLSEKQPLQAGTVLMIEPTAAANQSIPICCGDMYLIEKDGPRRLTHFPQMLVEL